MEMLQKDLCMKPQPKTESEIIASDSIDDKASALDVSASLKASFLAGLIEVGGSAKYLQDTKSSQQQARVTLQYKATTKYEQLTMSHLGIQNVSHPAVFERGTATHVVTAILYGAQAFFVFDREVSSSETVRAIQGNLQVVIERAISIKGEAEIQMNEKEKSHAENFHCKFHGDFSLKSNPVSFQDAMKIYTTLPKMLGEDGEKAVPVRVWLYPLTKLDSRAAKMVREVSLTLIFDAQAVMEQLNEISIRANDLAKDPITDTFPEIKKKIQQFTELCKQHRQTFQKQLARTLPSIRGGEKEEGALVDILTSVSQSPFSSQRLSEFLNTKEREINFVKSYLGILSGMEIVASYNRLEEIVLDHRNDFVVSFAFTSLHDEEPFLSSLKQWLQKPILQEVDDPATGRCVPGGCKAWFQHGENNTNARKSAKSISDFARVNKSNGKTQCVVASVPDGDNPGASIYLYEDGELVSSCFEVPSKPLPLLIGGLGHDNVRLTLRPVEYGRASVSSYLVEYKIPGEERWKAAETEDSRETFLLGGLSPNTEYQFRYAARSKPGLSESSDASQPVKTLPTSPPGKPRKVTAGSSVVSVAWESPRILGAGAVIKEYKVEYREEGRERDGCGNEEWNEKRTAGGTEFCHMDRLKPQTPYRVRVSAVCADGAQSDPSEEMEVSTTHAEEGKTRLAYKYLQESTLIERGEPPVYALPLQTAPRDASTSCLKYRLGQENLQVPNKVIMVMGAAGSGKTTLINGMINYILGVEWKDSFRFKLIHEETNRSQAQSQTSEVTAYEINYKNGFQIPYSLTIIDTPGFGDTKGIENDRLLTEKIREFFSTPGGIDHIDGVCFVVQGSLARLTQAQKYVFDSVLSIFGKDVKANIQILVTFADGQLPPVLEAILEFELPCAIDGDDKPVHFKFNNSALFASNSAANETSFDFDAMFWKMGAVSMKRFFTSLHHLEPRSLRMTKEVLQERKRLETAVQGLQPQIKAGLGTLEALRKTRQALEQHRDEMEANKNFVVEVERPVTVKIEVTDGFLTNCQTCHFTCHYPCVYGNDKDKHKCSSMDANGKCTVCPGKCVWNVHYNQKYRWEYKTVKEEQTFDQIKEKYRKACGEVMTAEKIFEQLSEEYECVENLVLKLIEESSRSIERLQEIALKPSPMAAPEHIDLLIESEKQEAKPGFQDRIKALEGVKEMAVIVTKIGRGERLLPSEEKAAKKCKDKPSKYQKVLNDFTNWFSPKTSDSH